MRVRSRSSRRHPPIHRSMIEFMRGIWTPLRTIRSPRRGKDRVEAFMEGGVAVVQQELDVGAGLIEVHAQVPGLLHDPQAAGMGGGAQDPDPAGGVFDRGQHVGLRAVQQVNGEQVQGQDRLGLGAQELRPTRAGTPGRGVDAMPLQDFPDRRGCDGDAEPGQLTGDPPVPPMLVVGRHAQHQADDAAVGRWSPRPLRSGSGGPAAADDSAVPGQDRARVMNECRAPRREHGMSVSSAANSARSVHVSLGRAAVCRCRTASWWRSRRISASFPRRRTPGQPQPRGYLDGEKEHEAQAHETRSSTTGMPYRKSAAP